MTKADWKKEAQEMAQQAESRARLVRVVSQGRTGLGSFPTSNNTRGKHLQVQEEVRALAEEERTYRSLG